MSAYRMFPEHLFVGSEALMQELRAGAGPRSPGR